MAAQEVASQLSLKNWQRKSLVSRDIIREELGYTKPGEKAVLNKEAEENVSEIWWYEVMKVAEGTIVIDDTNLNPKYRIEMIKKLLNLGFELEFYKMKTSLSTCQERRKGIIPENVVERMWRQMMITFDPKDFEGYPLHYVDGE